MKLKTLIAPLVVASFALAGCGGEAEGTSELDQVKVGLALRAPTPTHAAWLSIAQQQGYFEDEGLDVEIIGFDGSADVVQAVGVGAIDFGTSVGASTLVAAVAKGTPVVGYATQLTEAFQELYVKDSTPVETLADLKGKKVGVLALTASQAIVIGGALEKETDFGVDGVELVAVGAGPEADAALMKGQIDALGVSDGDAVRLRAAHDVRRVKSDYIDSLGFNTVEVTSRKLLEEDADLAVRLQRAIMKGIVFAKANPEAAVRIHWQEYPESKPTVDEEAGLAAAMGQLKARLENMQPLDGVWGDIEEERIDQHVDSLVTGGVIESAPKISEFWDPSLLKKINDFDAAKVEEEAGSWSERSPSSAKRFQS